MDNPVRLNHTTGNAGKGWGTRRKLFTAAGILAAVLVLSLVLVFSLRRPQSVTGSYTCRIGDRYTGIDLRVDEALDKMMFSREWPRPQAQWLQRIASQMKKEIIVDKEAMNRGAFKEMGGFNRINKTFNGELEKILGDMNDMVWQKLA